MTDTRQALGVLGEDRAARYLEERGWRIVDRNVRAGGVELDLIAQRGRVLAIVEVKTRTGTRQGSPVLAVDERKQVRIARGARAWLASQPTRRNLTVRLDVIACLYERSSGDDEADLWRVEHWPAAFDAP